MHREPISVLVAEPNQAYARSIRDSFGQFFPNARIEVVADIQEFVERSTQNPPSLALLDLNLASYNGLNQLLSHSAGLHFPVIVMTNSGNDELAVNSIKAGALDYIVKSPVSFEFIGKKAERVLWEWKLIQEKQRGQEALHESERFLRATLDALSANIAILDEAGVIISVNQAWTDFAEDNGATDNVSVGSNYLAVCDGARGEEAEEAKKMAEGIRSLIRGEQDTFSIEYPCNSPDEQRWFIGRATRFFGSNGRFIVVAHENITQRKLAELKMKKREGQLTKALNDLKDAQAKIIQQEKMASIGQLAAGVAHEINNPMGYITSNMNSLWKYAEKLAQFIEIQEQAIESCADQSTKTELSGLKRQIKLEFVMKDLRDLIAESLEGSKRVSKIVQDLKSFSRADGNEIIPSDLNECIRSTINVVRNEIKYVADLDLQLGDLPLVACRPQQISQVIMNLLVNAAHSISGKGTISVVTEPAGTMVVIRVSDTGCGIRPDHLDKIFEPFFTTKEPGKGTGLGLAISCDIIRKHGGELLVNSEVGRGSTFTIRLPVEKSADS